MKKYIKPILFILFVTPLLTELLSSNMPAPVLFNPAMFLLQVTVGYGFPVLLLREYSVKRNYGIFGLFFLGLIYGLYNEGLVARTIFSQFHSPLPDFASMGLWGSVRVPWTIVICVWHALHAVIYPIIFAHYLWPDKAKELWLSPKLTKVLWVLVLGFGLLTYFSKNNGVAGPMDGFVFMVIVSFVLWWFAKKVSNLPALSNTETAKPLKKYFWFGAILFLLLFLFPIMLPKTGIKLGFFVLYFAIILFFLWRKTKQNSDINLRNLVKVVIGNEIFYLVFTLLLYGLGGLAVQAGTAVIFLFVFFGILIKMKLKNKTLLT